MHSLGKFKYPNIKFTVRKFELPNIKFGLLLLDFHLKGGLYE